MIRSTQRNNASRRHPDKEKIQKENADQQERGKWDEEKANHRDSDDETAEGCSTNTDCDQDSDVSFMKDSDEEIDTVQIEEEEWIEYMKISTRIAIERMKAA